jgi:ADP-ribose pyrophosphatase YjhB (NUDIX family)
MPLRDDDARFAIGLDLLFVDAARQHVALIRRQEEQRLAMLGEKLRWGEPAATGILRALREELGIDSTDWHLHGAGLRAWRLGGLFGLDRPARDPRFLGAASLAERAQVLSLLFLIEADLVWLAQAARPGSSVLGLELLPVAALEQQSLFLDHATLIRQVLEAERAGRLPLLPVGSAWPLRSGDPGPKRPSSAGPAGFDQKGDADGTSR